MCCQRFQGVLPECVLLGVTSHEAQAKLIGRIVGTHEYLNAGYCATILFECAKGDRASEDMALRSHKGKTLVIGIEYHDTSRKWHACCLNIEQGDLARFDTGQRAKEAITGRPELREVRFPYLNNFFGSERDPFQAYLDCFLSF